MSFFPACLTNWNNECALFVHCIFTKNIELIENQGARMYRHIKMEK